MAGTQQYNFPPPPPPPGPPPNQQQPPQQYGGYAQPPPYQQARGGGAIRGGRGGAPTGRSDFHPAPFPHQNGYNGPPQPHHGQVPPQYNGPNGPQTPGPYIGPQPPQNGPGPNPGPGPNGYGLPQWQNGQNGPPHHGPQQPPMQHTPQPAQLPAQNYHPNYAPQSYNQPPSQYGPQQPPQPFQNSQPPPFGQHNGPINHQPPHNGPPQWSGPPQHGQPQFNNRGRGRGGFNNGRGGHESAPLMGPPIRMGFDNKQGDHMAQAGNGFPQQFPNHQSPPPPFSQPYTQGYSPHFPHVLQRPALDPNPYNSPNRARGGNQNNFRDRNRNGFNNNQSRGRNDSHQANNGSRSSSNNHHKPAGADASGKKKKKRRTNTLGLTPNGADQDESEEELLDDVDEEARLVTLLGPDTPMMPTDLDAWLEERKSRFPTKARREAAAEELRQRREQGHNGRAKKENGASIKKEEGETKLEKQQRKAEKLRLELEKAERKIQESMSGAKRKRETGDEGDDARDQSDGSSDGSSDSDNSKPEAMSSRNSASTRLPPPPKAQLQRHCKYFSTGGTCGKKGKCRFVHDQEVRNQALRDKEANGGKMTLAQRLILNDTAKDDLTILKSIKYLKEKGLMSEQLTSTTSGHDDDMAVREENGYVDNLNYGDNLEVCVYSSVVSRSLTSMLASFKLLRYFLCNESNPYQQDLERESFH